MYEYTLLEGLGGAPPQGVPPQGLNLQELSALQQQQISMQTAAMVQQGRGPPFHMLDTMLSVSDDRDGASTVAIDNKIEQAMDLVKSHLMFAVREEVEVLKEQIKELLEKNSQLEYENTILRSSASPETLAKLKIAASATAPAAPPPTTTSS